MGGDRITGHSFWVRGQNFKVVIDHKYTANVQKVSSYLHTELRGQLYMQLCIEQTHRTAIACHLHGN